MELQGQGLPHKYIRIVTRQEGFLELLELPAAEVRSAPSSLAAALVGLRVTG